VAVRQINPEVPEGLEAIIDRLLAKNPERRFQSATEVAEALSALVAPPPPPPAVGSSWGWLAWVASVLVLLACALGGTEATGLTGVFSTFIRVPQEDGVLVVEVLDPEVSVTIDGEEVVIKGAGVKEVHLKPATYKVKAVKGGKVVFDKPISITSN